MAKGCRERSDAARPPLALILANHTRRRDNPDRETSRQTRNRQKGETPGRTARLARAICGSVANRKQTARTPARDQRRRASRADSPQRQAALHPATPARFFVVADHASELSERPPAAGQRAHRSSLVRHTG